MVKEFRQKRLINIDYIFNFGKYAGFSYQEIVEKKPDYIKFLLSRQIIELTEEAKNELYHAEFKERLKISGDVDATLKGQIMSATIEAIDSYIK